MSFTDHFGNPKGLMKKLFSQTRKPEGTLWKSDHHPSKPWITVIAKKS